jgi:hypothetical protein
MQNQTIVHSQPFGASLVEAALFKPRIQRGAIVRAGMFMFLWALLTVVLIADMFAVRVTEGGAQWQSMQHNSGKGGDKSNVKPTPVLIAIRH